VQAAVCIREAIAQVASLREAWAHSPALSDAVWKVKNLQSRRFAGTYADLLRSGPYEEASRFFLQELYSDKDYALRDAQFSRIAGALQRLFPQSVVTVAVSLAQLHAMTEHLDHRLASAWLAVTAQPTDAARYVCAWRAMGRRAEREQQLNSVLAIGIEMTRLTRTHGLGLMLKMMRAPAAAAGLGALQSFLEVGFVTFARMASRKNGAKDFLGIVRDREQALLTLLFDTPACNCECQFQHLLENVETSNQD
jgi:hypothetical protein